MIDADELLRVLDAHHSAASEGKRMVAHNNDFEHGFETGQRSGLALAIKLVRQAAGQHEEETE